MTYTIPFAAKFLIPEINFQHYIINDDYALETYNAIEIYSDIIVKNRDAWDLIPLETALGNSTSIYYLI